jgi:ATP-binding cassette subfamily B protein
LLTRPAVLVHDDSTSAVDVETEARIQAALAEQRQTRFVVAQRVSSVLGADLILVLNDGEIVARGTHPDLLAASPIYREIFESQLEGGTVAHAGD